MQSEAVPVVEPGGVPDSGCNLRAPEYGRSDNRSVSGDDCGGRWRGVRCWSEVTLAFVVTWVFAFNLAGCTARSEAVKRDPGPGIVWGESHITIGVGPGGVSLGLSAPRAIESRSSLPSDVSPSVQAGRWVQDVDGWPALR